MRSVCLSVCIVYVYNACQGIHELIKHLAGNVSIYPVHLLYIYYCIL